MEKNIKFLEFWFGKEMTAMQHSTTRGSKENTRDPEIHRINLVIIEEAASVVRHVSN